jgi:hypothetical protein
MVFDEEKLRTEIIRIWGEYGVHIEIYDALLAELKILRGGESSLPDLSIHTGGNNGLSIRCKLSQGYNCVEFSLKKDVAQEILIAPWMQFEPIAMAEEKLRIATEMVRRAMVYDSLVKTLEETQRQLKWELEEGSHKYQAETSQVVDYWREERMRLNNLPGDFSDVDWKREIPKWPTD